MKSKTFKKNLKRKNIVYRVQRPGTDPYGPPEGYLRLTRTLARAACVQQRIESFRSSRSLHWVRKNFLMMRVFHEFHYLYTDFRKKMSNCSYDVQPLPKFVLVVFKSIWLKKEDPFEWGVFRVIQAITIYWLRVSFKHLQTHIFSQNLLLLPKVSLYSTTIKEHWSFENKDILTHPNQFFKYLSILSKLSLSTQLQLKSIEAWRRSLSSQLFFSKLVD